MNCGSKLKNLIRKGEGYGRRSRENLMDTKYLKYMKVSKNQFINKEALET